MPKRSHTLKRYLRETTVDGRPMTQRVLAHRLGISQPYLSQIMRGLRTPSLELAADIERETGVSMRSLLAVSA